MTTPGLPPHKPKDPLVDQAPVRGQSYTPEADDLGHYYFAPFVSRTVRGDLTWSVAYFDSGGYGSAFVDLRDPAAMHVEGGVAFVRAPFSPTEAPAVVGAPLPPEVFYVGQGINASLPVQARSQVRTRLNLRGQVTTAKDALRAMLLQESGTQGKPNTLASEADGSLYVYLGDLRIDLGQ